MRKKKKKVIASILAVSIFLQPVQTMTVSAFWPFGGKAQVEQTDSPYEEFCKETAKEQVELIKKVASYANISEAWASNIINSAKVIFDEKNRSIFAKGWGVTKTVLYQIFFGFGSIFPVFVTMGIFNLVQRCWSNFWTRRELGNTGKIVIPMEARQNFLNLAAGHKGQENAKNKLLNIGVCLAYSVLKKTPVRKLIFEVGPPGTGKTTLVEILASVLGCSFFNVGASDVDPGSSISAVNQIFGPRKTRANNSEYVADSPVMKFLRATDGQTLRIVAINEFDKLSEKDRKNLMEFLRNAYDNGYAYINGEKINLENVVWVLTSNDEDKTLFESPSLMSRFEVVKFARLTFQNYIEILITPFSQLAGEFAAGHNVHIDFGSTIPEIAQKLTEGNTGARGVQAYVNTLTSKILNYIYSGENVDKVKRGEPIFINVLYDKDNDGFIIKETDEAPTDAAEKADQEMTKADDAVAEKVEQKATETDDAASEEVVEQETIKPAGNTENSMENLPDVEDNKER